MGTTRLRLRELDREHFIYDHPKRDPGGSGPQFLTLLQLLVRLAALVPPPRIRNMGLLAPTAAYRKFSQRHRPAPSGR